MDLWKFIKSASRSATYLAVGALATLVVKILILNRWQAPFPFVYDFGVLVEAILASVVASYVFYLLVVHLKEVNDRKTVAPYIDRQSNHVVAYCESQLQAINKVNGTSISLENMSIESITKAFARISPHSDAPLIVGPSINDHANWIGYFEFHNRKTRDSIGKVMAQLIFLDAKRVSLLASVDDCSHFVMISILSNTRFKNTDMSAFAGSFHDYCVSCLAIKQYLSKK
jgi:hypothetical protein